MCVTICGRFCSDEGIVAGYDNRIRAKYTTKWGVQIAGMIFQTRSRVCLEIDVHKNTQNKEGLHNEKEKISGLYSMLTSNPYQYSDTMGIL